MALTLAVQSSPADVRAIEGRVVDVGDGDTITVVDAGQRQYKVRLLGIDALERGQPGGHRSKESLARLVYDRDIRVEWTSTDGQGVIVGPPEIAASEQHA